MIKYERVDEIQQDRKAGERESVYL